MSRGKGGCVGGESKGVSSHMGPLSAPPPVIKPPNPCHALLSSYLPRIHSKQPRIRCHLGITQASQTITL